MADVSPSGMMGMISMGRDSKAEEVKGRRCDVSRVWTNALVLESGRVSTVGSFWGNTAEGC